MQPPHPQSPGMFYPGKEIPLGLAYLAAYLEEEGIAVEILDMNVYDRHFEVLSEALRRLKPKVVGISAFTIDMIGAHEAARTVKRFNEDTITVIGGIHASALPEDTLGEFECFDYLIHGPGEIALTALVKKLASRENVSEIPGLAHRNGGSVVINAPGKWVESIDELPFPARGKFDLSRYAPPLQKYMTLPNTGIIASLGCPYSCTYCAVNIVHKKPYFRNPQSVVAEIEQCIRDFGVHDFRFFDDCITTDRARLTRLCELIIKKKLAIHWNCQSRVDGVDYEVLKLMKRAGCHQITYGVETASGKSLKVLNKTTTFEQCRSAIESTKKAGLESGASFMIGIPGETMADIEKTICFAKELSPDIATFYILKVYPGTALFREAEKKCPINTNWNEYHVDSPPVIDMGIPPDVVENMLKKAYREFYFRPRYVGQRMRKALISPTREVRLAIDGIKLLCSHLRK